MSANYDTRLITEFSDDVENVLQKILPNTKDELDAPDFDVYDYINRKFPDESSLGGLDDEILRCDKQIQQLDTEISMTVREQATASQKASREVEDSKASIKDLFEKIREIQQKSEHSEVMVQEICRDIKQLDVAKRNLTTSIETIHRLQMLINSVHRLEENNREQRYKDTGTLLEAVAQLFTHFEEYSDVPSIKEWMDRIQKVRQSLQLHVKHDFETLTELGLSEQYTHDEDDNVETGISEPDTDFASMSTQSALARLADACQVIDALGEQVRDEIIKRFCAKRLRPCVQQFRRKDCRTLENIERQYAWFRRTLRDIENKYTDVLPARWHIAAKLSKEFCEKMCDAVEMILDQYGSPEVIPAEPLVRALNKTLQFEKEMQKRFNGEIRQEQPDEEETFDDTQPLINDEGEVIDPTSAEGIRLRYKRRAEWEKRCQDKKSRENSLVAQQHWIESLGKSDTSKETDDANTTKSTIQGPKFLGTISDAFVPYIGVYVRLEASSLDALVEQLRTEGNSPDTTLGVGAANGSDTFPVFATAPQFFLQIKNSIHRCVQLNTGGGFFELYCAIKKSLFRFLDAIRSHLPEPKGNLGLPGDSYVIPDGDEGLLVLRKCALVVNTADYCADTVEQLEDMIRSKIDAAISQPISLQEVKDEMFNVASSATKTLSSVVACTLDPPLQTLWKTPWSSVNSVEDQSAYIRDAEETMFRVFPVVRQTLTSKQWRRFCDTFVRAFIPRFMTAVYKCKKLGDDGAQQLLLDAMSLNAILAAAPTMRTEEEEYEDIVVPNAPTSYTKYLKEEMDRVAHLLKLVAMPKSTLISSIRVLWPSATVHDVTKVTELKGLRRSEQQEILQAFAKGEQNIDTKVNSSSNPSGHGSHDKSHVTGMTATSNTLSTGSASADKRASMSFANVSGAMSSMMGGIRGSSSTFARAFSRRKNDGTNKSEGEMNSRP